MSDSFATRDHLAVNGKSYNFYSLAKLGQRFDLIGFEGPGYWLVYPEHRRNQAKVRAVRDWLLAEVEAMKATEPPEIFVEAR